MSATTHKKAKAFTDGIPFKIVQPFSAVPIYFDDEIKVNAKVKYTADGLMKICCFNKPRYKLDGFDKNEAWDRADILQRADDAPYKNYITDEDKQKNKADSLKRAKDKIFEIVACNDWSYMVTFTLDSSKVDRYDTMEVKKKFSKWCDNMVQRKGLKGIFVPELHQDGAVHFHGLVNDSLDFVFSDTYKVKGDKHPIKLQTLRKRGKMPTDCDVKKVYNVADYKLGFSTAIPLSGKGFEDDSTEGALSAVAFYMTKYATKELDKIFGSYYIAVGKIKRALPFFLCNMDFNELAEHGQVVNLPENFGQVVYATITKDDFEGSVYHGK